MQRLFAALPFPGETALHLKDILSLLEHNKKGLKIVPRDSYHLTLRFFGEVDDETAGKIISSIEAMDIPAAIPFIIKGLGAFPSLSRPSVLWAGLDCGKDIFPFQKKLESYAVRAGLTPEKRKFRPHLTLARVRKKSPVLAELREFIESSGDTEYFAASFSSLVLYESVLTPEGPEYNIVIERKLL